MPRYRVVLEGRNFLLDLEGKRGRYGFYQTVFVESADTRQAELDAVARVKSSEDLRSLIRNGTEDPPMLHLDSIDELGEGTETPTQPQGRTFYLEKSWWQFWR